MNINKFSYIVGLYIFGVMVSQLMGLKTIPLIKIGGMDFSASVAIFVLPLLFTLTDIVNEVYGRKLARKLVRLGIVIVVLQLIVALLFTALTPSERFAPTEAAYDTIFGTSIRFAIAALAAFALAELMDVAIFSKIRERLGKSKLWLRNNVSNFVAQFVDSAIFVFIAFYALDLSFTENLDFLFGIIIPYWLVRCALSILETPLVYLGVKWLKDDVVKTKSAKK